MIVFSNRSKLNKINVSSHVYVNQFKDSIKTIKTIEKYNSDRLTSIETETNLIKLLDKANVSNDVKLKHIEAIKFHINKNEL